MLSLLLEAARAQFATSAFLLVLAYNQLWLVFLRVLFQFPVMVMYAIRDGVTLTRILLESNCPLSLALLQIRS